MPKFKVTVREVTITDYEVEAENAGAARDKGYNIGLLYGRRDEPVIINQETVETEITDIRGIT